MHILNTLLLSSYSRWISGEILNLFLNKGNQNETSRDFILGMFVYERSGCGFESHWSHLNFRYHACFK